MVDRIVTDGNGRKHIVTERLVSLTEQQTEQQRSGITAAQVEELKRRVGLVISRLQMNIDDGSRPDQWSMESMQRDLHAALDAIKLA